MEGLNKIARILDRYDQPNTNLTGHKSANEYRAEEQGTHPFCPLFTISTS